MDTNSRGSSDEKQDTYMVLKCLSIGCLLVARERRRTNSTMTEIGQHLGRVTKINDS